MAGFSTVDHASLRRIQQACAGANQKIDFVPTASLWRLYDLTDQQRHDLDRRLDEYLTPDVGRTPFTKPDSGSGIVQLASSICGTAGRKSGEALDPPQNSAARFFSARRHDGVEAAKTIGPAGCRRRRWSPPVRPVGPKSAASSWVTRNCGLSRATRPVVVELVDLGQLPRQLLPGERPVGRSARCPGKRRPELARR